MEAAVQALSVDECDVLMKYIYRGCDASRLLSPRLLSLTDVGPSSPTTNPRATP